MANDPNLEWLGHVQPVGLVIDLAPVVLEHSQSMFAVRQKKIKKRGCCIKCVGQHQTRGSVCPAVFRGFIHADPKAGTLG